MVVRARPLLWEHSHPKTSHGPSYESGEAFRPAWVLRSPDRSRCSVVRLRRQSGTGSATSCGPSRFGKLS
jgi:hypothetical protein